MRYSQLDNQNTIFTEPKTRLDIIRKLRTEAKKKNFPKEQIYSHVIGMYFDIMMEGVLNGQIVVFPNKMKLSIRKYTLKKPKVWIKASFFPEKNQKFVYNPNRVGLDYRYHVESKFLDEQNYVFRLSDKWKKKLH